MKTTIARGPAIALGCSLALTAGNAFADVTLEERISVQGAGVMSMANMSGKSVTTISGKRARMESDMQMQSRLVRMFARGAVGPTAEIVRLDEDRVLQLDLKRKQYTETSLAEMRAQMEAAMRQANEAQQQQQAAGPVDESQCEWAPAKAEVKKTGEKGSFAGYAADRVTITASQACKDRQSGQVCEFALSLDQWLAPKFTGGEDAQNFYRAYAAKMGYDAAGSRDLSQRAEAMFGRYEGIWKEVAGKMKGLKGYPVKSSFALAIGGPQCQGGPQQAQAGSAPAPSGEDIQSAAATTAGQVAGQTAADKAGQSAFGGIAGQVGGKIAGTLFGRRKKQDQEAQAATSEQTAAAPALANGMVPLLTVTSELLSVSEAAASPAAFEVPPEFKKVAKND